MVMTKKTIHYVDNKKFLQALIDYKKACRKAKRDKLEKPPIPNYIGECFMKIAEGFSHRINYVNYSYREEMVDDAIENCIMYFENFDPKKSKNPFGYFTQIVYYAFLRRIAKEKKEQYTKYKVLERSILFADPAQLSDGESNSSLKPGEIYANIMEFTHNYEQSQGKKKKKIAKKKGLEKFYD